MVEVWLRYGVLDDVGFLIEGSLSNQRLDNLFVGIFNMSIL